MGSLFAYIIICIIVTAISICLGFIPTIIFIILDEMAGLGSYVFALTVVFASIVELIKFISYMFGNEVTFSIKGIFKFIKSIFKKKKEINNTNQKKTKGFSRASIIEIIIILIFVIYAIFNPIHSLLVSLIYSNVIVRILYVIYLPLVVCNFVNKFREGYIDGVGDFISELFTTFFVSLVIGIAIASTMLMIADSSFKDISKSIQSWFIYDNREYDELRKSEDFKSEYDYLKNSYEKTYNELVSQCDINEPPCFADIKSKVVNKTYISTYGYKVSDSEYINDEIELLRIVDRKDLSHKIYKINYRNFSFEKSTDEEFKSVRENNRS